MDMQKIDKKDLKGLIEQKNIVLKRTEVNELFNSPKLENKTLLVCEGNSDVSVYGSLFNHSYVHIFKFGTCNGLAFFVDTLSKQYKNRVIGIKDADFDYLNNVSNASNNLFLTDTHDLETMLFDNDVENKLYFTYLHDNTSNNERPALIDTALRHLEEMSYIKWLNAAHNLSLNVDCISFNDEIYDGCSCVNLEKCFEKLKTIPENNEKCSDIEKTYSNFKRMHYCDNLKLLVNGHDLCNVLAILLKKNGSHDKNINGNKISSIAISAYNLQKFSTTKLYRDLNLWAKNCCKILF